MTTKREFEQRAHYYRALQSLGFTHEECEQLRRISMTLRRWHELECGDGNGCIERDEQTGRPYWLYAGGRHDGHRISYIPDRETGARKRLAAIIKARNERFVNVPEGDPRGPAMVRQDDLNGALSAYIQGDPRGAALYILRPGDVPAGSTPDSCYSRGICVF